MYVGIYLTYLDTVHTLHFIVLKCLYGLPYAFYKPANMYIAIKALLQLKVGI